MPVRNRTSFLTVTALAAGLLTAAATAAASAAGAATAPANETTPATIRVLDWNIEGGSSNYAGARWDALAEAIGSYQPDVVTLQEVNRAAGTTVVHDDGNGGSVSSPGIDELAELSARFPQFADQITPDGVEYHQVWARADRGGAPGRSVGNVILSRFALHKRQSDVLPNVPGDGKTTCSDQEDYDGRSAETKCPVNRSFAGASVQFDDGPKVAFYTTHLAVGTGPVGTSERAAQTAAIVTKLRTPPITLPYLFTGDLNMTPDDANRFSLADLGLNDAWTLSHDNVGSDVATHRNEDSGLFEPNARIDNVWSSPGFDVTSTSLGTIPVVDGKPVSDHKPLVTDVAVHRPAVTRAAGVTNASGWATAAVSPNGSGALRACDNVSDPHGVLGYLMNTGTGATVASVRDDRYGDACGSVTVPAVSASTRLAVKICRNDAGVPADCVTKPL